MAQQPIPSAGAMTPHDPSVLVGNATRATSPPTNLTMPEGITLVKQRACTRSGHPGAHRWFHTAPHEFVWQSWADEREVLLGIFENDPSLLADRLNQTWMGDKNYFGQEFEGELAGAQVELLRPARKGEPERADAHLFKPLRQTIESINQTFKGQLTSNATAAYPSRRPRARPATHPRPHRRNLAQRPHPVNPSSAPSPPTTTDPLELII
jgi:hypothetical protein